MNSDTAAVDGADKPKKTIQSLVYNELRRSLMIGAFAPGDKVSLRSLAEVMGTSMMPVREAVNRLIAERAFEMLPNRSISVPPMTREKFDEITRWRVQLETEAVRRACHNADAAFIKRIKAINDKMIEAFEIDAREDVLSHNYGFHFAIYEAAESSVLLPMIESLWLQAGPFTYYSLPSPKRLWNAKFHRQIIDALSAKDPDAAAAAMESDIVNTADFLKKSGHYNTSKVRRIGR